MDNILKLLENTDGFCSLAKASIQEVKNAENTLNVKFAKDYHEIITNYGVVSANGHELTGICDFPRLNVTDVTLAERNRNPHLQHDMYVVEQSNIDGIVVLQNKTGKLFTLIPNGKIEFLCGNLQDYIFNY